MEFISFFAGIGGIDLGLERARHKCVGQVEIDPYCIKVLEKHWPDTWRHNDITTLKPEEIPEADLWTAGFPCQDISNAGKREGIRGKRSGLFFSFMELVCQVRPQYVLLENVKALLARGMGEVLGELSESGYDAEWDVISAASVGALHLRERVFIVANTKSIYGLWNTKRQSQSKPFQFRRSCLSQRKTTRGENYWRIEPNMGRVAHGVPSRVDRLKCLGNAVVPQVAEYIGQLLKE